MVLLGFKITLIPGDGIGPEIMKQAVKVIKSLEKTSSYKFDLQK